MLSIQTTENENIYLAIVNEDDSITELGHLVLFRKTKNGPLMAGFKFPKQIAIWRAAAKKRKNVHGEIVALNVNSDIQFKAKTIAVISEKPVELP